MLSACSDDTGKPDKDPGKDTPGKDIVVSTCDPEQDTCMPNNQILHCVDGQRKLEYCPENQFCFDGKCGNIVCEPNTIESCLEDGRYHGCNKLGTGFGDFECNYGKTCVDGECQTRLCLEGAGKCLDEETILLCNKAGTAYSDQKKCADISPKTICQEGACIPICEQTSKEASYIGCEYWAVDLDNSIDAGVYDAAGMPFAIVLSNTHDTLTADVAIYQKENSKTKKAIDFQVPPLTTRTIYLPDKCYEGGITCAAAYSVNGTTITPSAYYIKSDLPITAAQFNPLNNEEVYSNDASLLFPTTAIGKRYMIMGRRQHYDDMHAFMTVVATQPGQTEVVVKSTCKIMSGLDKSQKPIYAMKKGDIQTFYLDQFDVLNLETSQIGDDPTGSVITADKNIAVFSGNEATSIPETDPITCCADHIEHQQYPMGAWGKKYNAVKLKPRGKERDLWRILARTDETHVSFTTRCTGDKNCKTDSPILDTGAIVLNNGQWIDILSTESFSVEANAPILLGQFMAGQNDPIDIETGTQTPDWAGIGDPAYLIGVPIEQYRTHYQFLVPEKYKKDYITVIAPADSQVTLDGKLMPEDDFFTFGTGKFKAAYKIVEDGSHNIHANAPIGLFSYGFDNYVSYGYPAGLDLKELFD